MTYSLGSPRFGWRFVALGLVVGTMAAGEATAAPLAFPGAEGFAAAVTGGRKGQVVHVTTLADSGTGSLRDAVSQGNRTVVFDISGVITITSRLVITGDNLTLAGQTAPGDGIAIYGDGTSFSSRKNIIVRYLRFRQGIDTGDGVKAVNITDGQNMIFDHVAVQWGRWDNFGITGSSSTVTVQNSIIGEGIDPQRFGSIIDSAQDITVAHNLWIDNQSRNPKLKANGQYINNVVYDWGGGGGVVGGHSSAPWYEDLINNYLIAGPTTADGFLNGYANTDHVYQTGNLVDVNRDGTLNGRAIAAGDFMGDTPPTFETTAHNQPPVPVTVLSAPDAYTRVLAQAGTCLLRDGVEQRLIAQLESLGKTGAIITDENVVGGQPALVQMTRPASYDTDGDGMSDAWETAHGLDPKDAADGNGDLNGDGYTNVEEFLNSLADLACSNGAVTAPPDAGAPPVDAGAPATDAASDGPGGSPDVGSSERDAAVMGPDSGISTGDARDAQGPSAIDSGASASDASGSGAGGASPATPATGSKSGGCGCSTGVARRREGWGFLPLAATVAFALRRRRTPRPRGIKMARPHWGLGLPFSSRKRYRTPPASE